jgi:hypothetical protein
MDPVSCVSCVSSCYCVNAGETHETFRQESGMRYQSTTSSSVSRHYEPGTLAGSNYHQATLSTTFMTAPIGAAMAE